MEDTSRPAITEVGELALMLAGVSMILRPSYEAIQAIEGGLGRGMVDLARDAIGGKLTLAETSQVATHCIRAWGRDSDNRDAAGATADRIARLILDSDGGVYEAQRTVSAMLSLAVTGGYTSTGEMKPSTMTKTTTAAPRVDG